MSWSGAPQWLPRRRQKLSEASPASPRPGQPDFKPLGKSMRSRVTSGGSIIRSAQRTFGSDSMTGTESELGIDLSGDRTIDDDIVILLDSPIHEPIPATNKDADEDLGLIPKLMAQGRVDDLHDLIVAQNLATANNFSEDAWQFE